MHTLLGLWSTGATGLRYSAFETETLALHGDGTGWLHFTRPAYQDLTILAWQPLYPRVMALRYLSRHEAWAGRRRRVRTDDMPARAGCRAPRSTDERGFWARD